MSYPAEKKESPQSAAVDEDLESDHAEGKTSEVTGVFKIALAAMDSNLLAKRKARESARRAISASTMKTAEMSAEAVKK